MRHASHAVSCPLGDGVAILDSRENRYFSLNPVGAVIWSKLDGRAAAEDVAGAVVEAFEIDAETARRDVERLLSELAEAGLIEAVD